MSMQKFKEWLLMTQCLHWVYVLMAGFQYSDVHTPVPVLPVRNNTPSKDIQDLNLQNSILPAKCNIPKQTDQKPWQTLK
jgi:hypothetical protein